MPMNKTVLAASAATSLFAAASAASAAIVGTGGSVAGHGFSTFVTNGLIISPGGNSLSLIGAGTLDDGGTFAASTSGTEMVPGFPNGTLTASESFTGTYNSATGVFTPSAGSLDILTCTGSTTICKGVLSQPLVPFNTGVGGTLSLAAGGTLTGTAFQPSAGTVPAVTSFYSFVVGPFTPTPPVPLPPAAWLLGSGLLGLIGRARRRRTA